MKPQSGDLFFECLDAANSKVVIKACQVRKKWDLFTVIVPGYSYSCPIKVKPVDSIDSLFFPAHPFLEPDGETIFTYDHDPDTQFPVIPTDEGIFDEGLVYVGGTLALVSRYYRGVTAKRIASYNSRQWEELGGGLSYNYSTDGKTRCTSIAVDSSGKVYIFGSFAGVDTILASNIARYDPATDEWFNFNDGRMLFANAEAIIRGDRSGDKVVVDVFDGIYVSQTLRDGYTGIYKYNLELQAFCRVGSTVDGDPENYNPGENNGGRLSVYGSYYGSSGHISDFAIDSAGRIYAGVSGFINKPMPEWDGCDKVWNLGRYAYITGGLAFYDPDTDLWAPVRCPDSADLSVTIPYGNDECMPSTYLTGEYCAFHDGMSPIGYQVPMRPNAIAIDCEDNVYAGGNFAVVCDQWGGLSSPRIEKSANGIAMWDRTTWHALGSGITTVSGETETAGNVKTIAIAPDGMVYVGGSFNRAGGIEVHNIASWNPATEEWSALGDFDCDPDYPSIYPGSLVKTISIDENGLVYVGGRFRVKVRNSDMYLSGTGVDAEERGVVNHMAVWNPTEERWYDCNGGISAYNSEDAGTQNNLYFCPVESICCVPSSVAQRYLYWQAQYDCEQEDWIVSLQKTRTIGPVSDWTETGTGVYQKVVLMPDPPARIPPEAPTVTPPQCYYEWIAEYDCSSETWSVVLDSTNFDGPVSAWALEGDTCHCTTNSITTPGDPGSGLVPTCYYQWSAYYDIYMGWTITLEGVSTGLEVSGWECNTAGDSCTCVTDSSATPANPPDPTIYYTWEAYYDCSSASWQVYLMWEETGGEETGWSGCETGYCSCVTTSDTQPAAPSVTPTCYYTWEAYYNCETSSWSVSLSSVDTSGTVSGWSGCDDGQCTCVTTTDTQPSAPTETPSCYYYWYAYYDCGTSAWDVYLMWTDTSGSVSGWSCMLMEGWNECYCTTATPTQPADPTETPIC